MVKDGNFFFPIYFTKNKNFFRPTFITIFKEGDKTKLFSIKKLKIETPEANFKIVFF